VFVRSAASESARQALEALMTTKFKDTFVDRLLAEGEAKGRAEGEAKGRAEGQAEGRAEGQAEGRAEGKAEGEARMILRVLSARGLPVPAEIRRRVLSCADLSQLEAWGDRAATAASIDDVFGA
jgi:predicted transposase YdaD